MDGTIMAWVRVCGRGEVLAFSKMDEYVKGGEAEAEVLFMNRGRPVHCLSTRFESVNYRVSMLIGKASEQTNGVPCHLQPQLVQPVHDE